MSEYLSIGKVSKLKNVSIKSLRYYDEIGIFKPAYVNEKTNYRYYTEEQLPLLDAISLCIEIGIPLKDFDSYRDTNGNTDLHRLLCEGKCMAEEKIKAMGKRLEALSNTIDKLESANNRPAYQTKEYPERSVLAVPFDIATTPTRYNHLILSLFVEAQKLGLKVSYPSGFLYEREGNTTDKFVFLMLNSPADKDKLSDTAFRIFSLKGGTYYYAQSQTHQIEDAHLFFRPLLPESGKVLFIEPDLLSDNDINKFELQLRKEES